MRKPKKNPLQEKYPDPTPEWNGMTAMQQEILIARAEELQYSSDEMSRLVDLHGSNSDLVVIGMFEYQKKRLRELVSSVGINPEDLN